MNAKIVFVALAVLEAACIWFFGWQLYVSEGLNMEVTQAKYQLILICLMIIAVVVSAIGVVFSQPKHKKSKDEPDEQEEEKPDVEKLKTTYQILNESKNKKDLETFAKKHEELLEEIIPEETKLTKEDERINIINQKIKEVAKEAQPVPTDASSGVEPEWTSPYQIEVIEKPKDPTSLKNVLETNKIRVHNAIVNNLIKQLENGEIKVEPTEETIRKLGLSDITLKTNKKTEPSPIPEPVIEPNKKKREYPQPFDPIKLEPSDAELEMEKPLLSRRRN